MTSLTVEVPAELLSQQTALNTKIEEIVKSITELTNQKVETETNLRRVDTAIRYLRGEAIPVIKTTGARRPMTEEAKKRIGDALRAAAARKKAAASAPEMPETVVNSQPEGTAGPNAAGRLSAKKSAKKS